MCTLTLDASLGVWSVEEDVAAKRAHWAEELLMAKVVAARALVEDERACVWKMPFIAVVTQAPELRAELAWITFTRLVAIVPYLIIWIFEHHAQRAEVICVA